ncbi:DUF4142 domain-containing protein [Niabella sp. W65]|nr:DUF4142 domain-containing protein [Niabella sp. W65]MCH7364505.1 DUF4142 domain-containing protein [Niabella sp. W65]ULT40365.1 DUF4142 domain-containing protein [Niabella sp. I65]
MKNIFIIAALSVLLSCENSNSPESIQKNKQEFEQSPVKSDIAFIGEIGQGCLLEIHLAQLAQGKALEKKYTTIGKKVESDFIDDMEHLKTIAVKRSVNLPTSYSKAYRRTYQMVAHKHKDNFDRAYTNHLIEGYKNKIDQYQKEATEGKDALIRQWASERLPLLQRRLREMEDIVKGLK